MRFAACLVAMLIAQPASTHTTHYPRHGGQLFPAAGDTLHVEVVWPRARVLQVYVYDLASHPLPLARLRAIAGTVHVGRVSAPLRLDEHERRFEAVVPAVPPPAEMVVQLTLQRGAEPEGVMAIFQGYSDARALTFALAPTPIPSTRARLIAALRADVAAARALFDTRQSAYAFAPAVRARDHALAAEKYVPSLPPDDRQRATLAIRDVVRTAWLLHIAVDEGTVEQGAAAMEQLAAAVDDLVALFPAVPR